MGLGRGEIDDPAAAAGESPGDAQIRAETARRVFEGRTQSTPPSPTGTQEAQAQGAVGAYEPEWYEMYQNLKGSGFKWRVAAYIAWAASPKIGRWPKTQEELATQVLGLSTDRVIGTWRRKNPAIDELVSDLQAAPLLEARADVFKALRQSAAIVDHRSNPDRKLFLEMTGDYVPHAKIDLGGAAAGDDLSQYSEEELRKMAKKALDDVSEA